MVNILGAKLPLLIDAVMDANPKTYIEIGCYQCDTMKQIRRTFPELRIIGFDLFKPHEGDTTDKGKGIELAPIEEPPVTADQARAMKFEVYEGDTKQSLPEFFECMAIELPVFVFLDGGHSYETVKSDYDNICKYLPDATTVIDDVDYPGVAQLIREIPTANKKFLGLAMIRVRSNG